ncbi:hypothetical protein ABZU75_21305 [Streptosporangium sp. NPDC005286]
MLEYMIMDEIISFVDGLDGVLTPTSMSRSAPWRRTAPRSPPR